MKNVEVELRSFITKEKYEELIYFFKQNAQFVSNDDQVTYYFDSKEDLRIQRNNFFSKIWLKKGRIHDESREEIEIKFDKEDFETLEKLFLILGYNVEIKWFRRRHSFKWQDVNVSLDYTKGYGYIIELEDRSLEKNKELVLNKLKEKLKSLDVELTPKEEFDKKFEYYKNNWEGLVKE